MIRTGFQNLCIQTWTLIVLILVGALAPAPTARAQEESSSTHKLGLAALDANPSFLDGLLLPLSKDAAPADDGQLALSKLIEADALRSGVAADGVSLILLRATFNQPGEVTFSLDAKSPEGRLGTIDELGRTSQKIKTQRVGRERYVALAVYTPPQDFGADHAGEDAFSRKLNFTATLTPERGQEQRQSLELQLVRPPVVLVHGMFHNPRICWQTRPPQSLGKASMQEHLQSRGFKLFLCDYERTNGRTGQGPSRLRDNQRVVWENPGGIQQALMEYRKQGFAVTQADVVGHSMGGLLARAYARGTELPRSSTSGGEDDESEDAEEVDQKENWYLRSDNFQQGDIHRLITISTPHQGSDLLRLLSRLTAACRRAAMGGPQDVDSMLQMVNRIVNLSTGAFVDQTPGSQALQALGATRVPSHALACIAEADDFQQFNGRYRWIFLTVYLTMPLEVLRELFTDEQVGQAADAQLLLKFRQEHPELHEGVMQRAGLAMLGLAPVNPVDEPTRKLYDDALAGFIKAVFQASPHDGAVSQSSQLGGLKKPEAKTVLKGVLHSWAARYPGVQEKIAQLLEGDAKAFDPDGFPGLEGKK